MLKQTHKHTQGKKYSHHTWQQMTDIVFISTLSFLSLSLSSPTHKHIQSLKSIRKRNKKKKTDTKTDNLEKEMNDQ